MDTTLKIAAGLFIAVIFVSAIFFVTYQPVPATGNSVQGNVTVYFFYGEECPHCHNVMPFMESLKQKYPVVDFQILETWHNAKNHALSASLNRKLGIQNPSVPEVILGNVVLIGERDIPANLEPAILEALKNQ